MSPSPPIPCLKTINRASALTNIKTKMFTSVASTRGKEKGNGEGSGRGQALHDVKIIFLQQHPGLPREARARHAHGLAGNASLGCQRQARQSRFCQPEPYRPSHNMHAYKSQCGGRCNQETKLFCQSFLLMCFHVLTFVLLCTPLSS